MSLYTPPLPAAIGEVVEESKVFAKITRLLIPFMFLLYVVGYLDRINVGFAALTMKADLGLSEKAYGFGAGFFFIGYFLFEVPSNLILERVGARRWIARIMVTWGIIACGTGHLGNARNVLDAAHLIPPGQCGGGWNRHRQLAGLPVRFRRALRHRDPSRTLGELCTGIDRRGIDGAVRGNPGVSRAGGKWGDE